MDEINAHKQNALWLNFPQGVFQIILFQQMPPPQRQTHFLPPFRRLSLLRQLPLLQPPLPSSLHTEILPSGGSCSALAVCSFAAAFSVGSVV